MQRERIQEALFGERSLGTGLFCAPGTVSSHGVVLVFYVPEWRDKGWGTVVIKDGQVITVVEAQKHHLVVEGLLPDRDYHFTIRAEHQPSRQYTITVHTKEEGRILDVTGAPYAADGTGGRMSTEALQRAIWDARPGDTVLIPEGAVVLSGALDLKSGVTLQVDGVLQGSSCPEDYLTEVGNGLVRSRYEGWEMDNYRGLLNAGHIIQEDRSAITCRDVRICGKGTIRGGGDELGTAMRERFADPVRYPRYVSDGIAGRRVRGSFIRLVQCSDVEITGVQVEAPHCWTIQLLYSQDISTHGIRIVSRGVDNGDGWDPDSSSRLLLFDTSFNTGDDCVAIKSGKNPEGDRLGIPAKDIWIFEVRMRGGHGMAVGSEMSGGVENVYLTDCEIWGTDYGLEVKVQKGRGGYIRNVRAEHCLLDQFLVHSVEYNADGEAAPGLSPVEEVSVSDCRFYQA